MPLYRVPVTGGTPAAETELDSSRNETSHRYAEFLPDGKHYLFLVESSAETTGTDQGFALFVGALGSKEKKLVVATNGSVRFSAATGHLLFVRGSTIYAMALDLKKMKTAGHPVPVREGVLASVGDEVSHDGSAAFGVVGRGTLFCVDAPTEGTVGPHRLSRLAWLTSPSSLE